MSLPAEIFQIIFNHLDTSHDGLRTLFSCLLVNRYWCTNITKILWSKPFYYANAFAANPSSYKIIDIYLACLDEEVREDLRNKGVNLPVTFNKPLFPYESYHKHLYYRTFISCVYLWVQENRVPYDNLFEIIMKILLKLFKERCKTIQRTLYIIGSETSKGSVTPMFYVQPERGYLFSNINKIWVDLHIPRFLDLLAKNCKRVEQFGVFMKDVGRFNESGSVDVAKFITEQKALQSFQCVYLSSIQNVIDALETQADSLRCVDFICANFQGCDSLDGLAACNNLEILRFRKCYNITDEIVSPLFEASFPKLINVSVIQTDCNALQIWAESLFYVGDEIDDSQDTLIQFELDHVRELMLNNKICRICNELCIYPLTTTCGHTFCKDCISHHLNMYYQCPIKQCRTELSNTKYFYEHPSKPTDAIISERRRLEAERRSLQEMPIYVGHLVFPKMTYTFNVTERKYKQLIGSCLESRYRKKFGMLLSRRCEYGTLMEIKQVNSDDEDDLILQAVATDRFKVLSNLEIKDSYEIANVQIVEDELEENEDEGEGGGEREEEIDDENSSFEPTTSQLIKTARDFINGNELVSLMLHLRDSMSSLGEIPENAADFSFHVALILPVKDEERYELLGKRSTKERMLLVVMWIDYLRSQCCTLIINRIRNRSNLNVIYSWIIASLQDFCVNYFFYRN